MMDVRHTRRVAPEKGVTLIELLVTVVVMGVLASFALPGFSRLIASSRMTTQTNEFIAGLNLARSEAVKRSQNVAVRADKDGIEFAEGWTVFTDKDGNGEPGSTDDDGAIVRVSGRLAGQTSVKRVTASGTETKTYANSSEADKRYVVFNARGGSNSGARAYFKICDLGNPQVAGRIVQVSVVGKVSVDSTTESCSST